MKLLRWTVLVLMMLTAAVVPAVAQDNGGQECDAATIHDAMDEMIKRYIQAQDEDEEADDALADVEAFYEGAGLLIDACAEAIPQATPEAEAEATAEATEGELAAVTEGKWVLNWTFPADACPAINAESIGTDIPVIVTTDPDENSLTIHQVFRFGGAEFSLDDTGRYRFVFNVSGQGDNRSSFAFIISSISAEVIEGTVTDFYSFSDCSATYPFSLELVDEAITCIVGSERAVNLRAGAGTNFDLAGTLRAGITQDVIGQTVGSDEMIWWQLAD